MKITRMRTKKIYINDENREEIQKMIDDAHVGNVQNHVMTVDDVFNHAAYLTKRMSILPKRLLKGVVYYFNVGENKSNSYRYKFSADQAWIRWTTKGWILSSVNRGKFWPNENISDKINIELKKEEKEEAEKEITNILYKNFMR